MSTPARVFADRYSLDVQVPSTVGTPVWRAMDQVLKRWVTIYVMPRSDVRSPAVIAACHKAAAAMPRQGVSIIDIVEQGTIRGIPTVSAAQEHLGVITEWTEGTGLDRRLLRRSEPMPSDAALRVVRQVAAIVEQAHSRGLQHGRLRPHNIVFDDNDDIRITGFGIEAAVMGPDRSNMVHADVQGLGNLLFAMTTGKWPDEGVDGLSAASTDGAIPKPSAVHGSASGHVDAFFRATQDGTIVTIADALSALHQSLAPAAVAVTPEPEPVAPEPEPVIVVPAPESDAPISTMPTIGELAARMRAALPDRTGARKPGQKNASRAAKPARTRPSRPEPTAPAQQVAAPKPPKPARRALKLPKPALPVAVAPRPSTPVSSDSSKPAPLPVLAVPDTSLWHPEVAETRKRAILIAFISVLLFGWLGWRMLTLNVSSGPVASPTDSASASASASPSPSGSPTAAGTLATIVSARDYDPFGDGAENTKKVARAIDGNLKTAWQTNVYDKPLGQIKPGVGLVLNLGAVKSVSSVHVTFTAPGTSVAVYVTNKAEPKLKPGQLLGSVPAATFDAEITNATPMSGRYVVVWLTNLPVLPGGGYQVGIDEVTVTLK